jgi:hypothetical protein
MSAAFCEKNFPDVFAAIQEAARKDTQPAQESVDAAIEAARTEWQAEHDEKVTEAASVAAIDERSRVTGIMEAASMPAQLEVVSKLITEGTPLAEAHLELLKDLRERKDAPATAARTAVQSVGADGRGDVQPSTTGNDATAKGDDDTVTGKVASILGAAKAAGLHIETQSQAK